MQSVDVEEGIIEFKNYFKQLPVSFKVYADFECNEKRVRDSNRSDNASYTEKYQVHIPCSFAYKVVCVDDRFSKPVVLYSPKNAIFKFIETILKEYDCRKKFTKKHSNKNLVMSEKV